MRILDLTGSAADQFKGHTVHNHPDGQPYDVVVTRHHLSSQRLDRVTDPLKPLSEMLVDGGEMHLLEPSAEWTSREIKAGRIDVPFYIHVYGTPENPQYGIFTLEQLREIVTEAGLLCRLAMTRPYIIAATSDGREFQADQHYVVAMKPNGGGKTWMPD